MNERERGQVQIKNLASWVVNAKKGDLEAMGYLIEQTQDKLMKFCVYLCRDAHLAQDLCQDAYIKALDKIKKLKEPQKFEIWLFQVTKNLYFDYLRVQKGKNTVSLE